jgi:molecular chaperone GrpE
MTEQEELMEQPEPIVETSTEATEETVDATIAQLKSDLEESKKKYLYLYSDLENLRRNAAKERMDTIATAGRDIITALLPVLDDFDRAAKANPLPEGIDLIRQKIESTLLQKGLRRMELQASDPFNPDEQEAVAELPASSPEQKGTIVDVLEQGYMLGGKIIRFAKVVVFRGAE